LDRIASTEYLLQAVYDDIAQGILMISAVVWEKKAAPNSREVRKKALEKSFW